MLRKLGYGLAAVLLALFVTPAFPCEQCPHHNVFFADDGDKFDLSELYDGETRYFGGGDHQVRAERDGDQVTLTVLDDEDGETEFTCSLDSESCFVVTGLDDDKVMIMKSSSGDGAFSQDITVMAAGDAALHAEHQKFLVRTTEGAGNELVFVSPEGEAGSWVDEDGDVVKGHPRLLEIQVGPSKGVMLRCPEGDATLQIDEDEKEEVFLCPRHNVPMEPVDNKFQLATPKVHRVERNENQ